MCDRRPSMAQATIFAAGARGVALEGDVRFSDEIISASSAFALVQALSSGSLDYVADHSSELCLYGETSSEDGESSTSFPLTGLLCAT
jgi:hypothetical protein